MSRPDNQTTAPKLAEIASRIAAHLKRIEMAQPDRGSSETAYWQTSSWASGSRVGIRYVSFQHTWHLTKADAWKYLLWLDAGHEGKHFSAAKEAA